MADTRSLIIGRMKEPQKFTSTARRISKVSLPPRNKKEHRKFLLENIEAVEFSAKKKAAKKVPDATHSLLTIEYAEGSEIKTDSLESKRDGVRVVYEVPEQNRIVLDVPKHELKELKKKIKEYGEKLRVSPAAKDKTPKPANQNLVAPIERIEELKFKLIWGLNLQASAATLNSEAVDWFEFSCRGGVYEPAESNRSRREVQTALELVCLDTAILPEYLAPERIFFFIRCSLSQAKQVFELTDCVFELELVPAATLNWLLREKVAVSHTTLPVCATPPATAPSIVVVDSGINSIHPMIENAVALQDSVHPEDPSPVDEIGHGTGMSGVGLYGESVSAIAAGREPAAPNHWVESIRVFKTNNAKSNVQVNWRLWAKMTSDAIQASDTKGRGVKQKVFCLAITAPQKFPGSATSWSLAADQLAYNNGSGRLICVSVGNTHEHGRQFCENYPLENHTFKLEDPSQAANVISVGAYTKYTSLPPDTKYSGLKVIAGVGNVSPHTRSGNVSSEFKVPVKPDVVFEGGNYAMDDFGVADDTIPSLTATSIGHEPMKPIVGFWGTSLAAALASKFAADVWSSAPHFRPETVRGLMIHSASWTEEMQKTFGNNTSDLLALCGYGVPSMDLATRCTFDRATIVVEDELANLTERDGGATPERQMKLFELPLPKNLLLQAQNKEVELRVYPSGERA